MWKSELSPYIKIIPTPTSSVLALVLDIPNYEKSIHVGIYLPTSGKETEYLEELSNLEICIHELRELYPSYPIFIRGDANANFNHKPRNNIFNHYVDKNNFKRVFLNHTSYHHFTGNGASDSELDVILHTMDTHENVERIECKEENPLIDSHHDIVVSAFSLSDSPNDPPDDSNNVTAPKVHNDRVKILWSEANILKYKDLIGDSLDKLFKTWADSSSSSSVSILLSSTNSIQQINI